jgi:hypothetical protein
LCPRAQRSGASRRPRPARPSLEALITCRPSPLNDAETTGHEWPRRTARLVPSARQSRTVPSLPAVAIVRPSGLKAAALTVSP